MFIYADKGTCMECVVETEKSLSNELSNYSIKRIMADELLMSRWQGEAALLVIPGGRATPYAELLNGKGNDLIRQFVEGGGSVLGLCAGGYYGGAFVEFAKDTTMEVVRKHELAFFPGTVIGPVLADYDYYSESGARAARIKWIGVGESLYERKATLYYNGGGYFAQANEYPKTSVIATYEGVHNNPAAIIEVLVAQGVAILSGVHFEYNCSVLNRIDWELNNFIEEYNCQRRELLRNVLSRLGLKLMAS
ncbi:MAG: hypothetical protein KC505_00850 [Myxococcales bacterium]|nr:hypothetical protein [Myxococcales bacterium]USN50286.1 MAG: biotin--protein ligase [Myxococcales bacterium]